MNLSLAYWSVGLLTIVGHLLKAFFNEPGSWKDFFADKRNIVYLVISSVTSITLLIVYAATDGTDDAGAIMFASTVSFGVGSMSRGVVPSVAEKERKASQAKEPSLTEGD